MYFDREEKSIERILNEEAASPLSSLARSKHFTIFNCQKEEGCKAQGLISRQIIDNMIKYK